MKLRISLLLIILSASFSIIAQNYDKTYFRSPLNIPIKLVGNFGEIRPNHFHSGIDLKVPYSGISLYAAADGYISRIRKAANGYGNALYITHPNGLMTVYGHMEKFSKELEIYSKTIQYNLNNFEFTDYPDSEKFKVKKGDLIGYAGNTGRSYGPHLHFEVREADKDVPINPLLFDFGIKDHISPKLFNIIAYPIDESSTVQGNTKSIKYKLYKNGNSNYIREIIEFEGKLGLAFNAFDYVDGSRNSQGIYAVEMFLDDELIYAHKLDKISFYETRYLNSFIDYEEKQLSNNKFQKCYIDPGNKLTIYTHHKNFGIIELDDNKIHVIRIIVSDINQNESIINLKLKGQKSTIIPKKSNNQFKYNSENYFVKDYFRAYLKENTLYNDVEIDYSIIFRKTGLYSDIHTLNSYLTPAHQEMHIAISTKDLPKNLLSKALIVYIDKNGNYDALGGNYINGFIAAKSKNFGKFAIAVDQNPPTIILEAKDLNNEYYKNTFISLKIKDDLSGINNYSAEIDGKPIIFEYDEKNDRISYTFDDHIKSDQNHHLKITVFDKKNNKSVFQTTFFK